MNREIKFRVWFNDQMIYDYNHSLFNQFSKYDGDKTNPAIFMEFTGLTDKNSNNIYEGDIVKWDDGSNGRYWRFAVVEINPDIQFSCKYFKKIKGVENSSQDIFNYGTFAYKDTENHLTAIGNIHEGVKE